MSDLLPAVQEAAENACFLRQLREILTAADAAIASCGAICRQCGKCCSFAKMDHQLFVSTGELALLTTMNPPCAPAPLRCPYQVDSACTARDLRPLGCRIYYCDPTTTASFSDIYEQYHRRILFLHRRFGSIYYYYTELTSGLVDLGSSNVRLARGRISAKKNT